MHSRLSRLYETTFDTFCEKYGITHILSSAYHPQSNGAAEAAVKNVKYLLKKHGKYDEIFKIRLSEWRNSPRVDGYSPAQMFFGRHLRGHLPIHPSKIHRDLDRKHAAQLRKNVIHGHKQHYDKRTKPLPQLTIGDKVRVQDPKSGQWLHQGAIVTVRENGRSYEIEINGKRYLRNRRYLRKCLTPAGSDSDIEDLSLNEPQVVGPRRSERLRQKRQVTN